MYTYDLGDLAYLMEGGASMIIIYIHLKSLAVYNFLTVINGVIIMPRINVITYVFRTCARLSVYFLTEKYSQ